MIPKERIEREKFSIVFYENGITELSLNDNAIIDLPDAMEQEKLLQMKMPENGHLLLVIPGPGTNITRESREYSNKNPMDNKALAMIAKSLPQKIVINFLMTAYRRMKPKYPMKMFLKKEDAVDWLLSHN
jgi:hypothetical protein